MEIIKGQFPQLEQLPGTEIGAPCAGAQEVQAVWIGTWRQTVRGTHTTFVSMI
jgi:hypothetical protein